LVIRAASVIEISCGKTDDHTNTAENPTSATFVGVDKDDITHYQIAVEVLISLNALVGILMMFRECHTT